MCCNPTTDFEDRWLIKSSFITKDEKLTTTKAKKNRYSLYIKDIFELFLNKVMGNNNNCN
jgi:hypothetical protein